MMRRIAHTLLTSVAVGIVIFPMIGRAAAATPAQNAASTVVIYNLNNPESKGLADFYCSARSIDPSQEIGLTAPVTEEISRSDYDSNIATPLRQTMIQRGYWILGKDPHDHPLITASRIHYAVLMRGIPLKVQQCTSYQGDNTQVQQPPFGTCNAASVDSELSLLGLYNSQISGVFKNPLYVKTLGGTNTQSDSNPNIPVRTNAEASVPAPMLLVGRLDAPTADAVKAMILNGIKAEKEGLWGWGYIDLRSITDPGFIVGDQWIAAAAAAMRKNGIPVISDDLPEIFQQGFPITDAAEYFGWYSGTIDGPFGDPAFHFLPGAVAMHLHSFSASTLHDSRTGWTGPLIEHGASASVGNVYEPYLIFTTDFGILEEKLLSGWNLAQSYYAAEPVLSWMSILVGDPLYRPYASLHDLGDKRTSVWKDYRSIILAHHGDVLKAAADLGARAREAHESLYLEALGVAQLDAGYFPSASASFEDASAYAKDPRIQFRLLLEQARALEKWGKNDRGASLLREGLNPALSDSQRGLALAWIQRLDPIKVPSPSPTPSAQASP